MNITKLKTQLIHHEGFRGQVYDDATGETLRPGMTLQGNPTVGIGRNLLGNPLTNSEAHYLLENDLFRALMDLTDLLPDFFYVPERIQHVLLDMRFNLGYDSFLEFEDMISAVKARDWPSMRAEMIDSLWYSQVGRRGPDLVEMIDEVIDDT